MTEPSPIDIIPKLLEPYFDDIECQLYDEHLANKFRGDKLTEHLIIRDCIDGDIGDDMDESYSYLFIIEDTNTHKLYAYDHAYLGDRVIEIEPRENLDENPNWYRGGTSYAPKHFDDIIGPHHIDYRSWLMWPIIEQGAYAARQSGDVE